MFQQQTEPDLAEYRAIIRNIIATFGPVNRAELMQILWNDALRHPEFSEKLIELRCIISDMSEQQVAEALKRWS